ncbi:hypothetical protein BV22DRAFT_1135550 [Leucogyrophana mollusca]|uniref:Uncharacterized protein n=1 Tax=Leucogyrophana mollusca TaxID=85980 RepID=A0ACB8AWB5_9AGAM|nr:hypothetical protein BV22DRAFT_1135550 [Leucogyrophana mollusca]
MPTLSPNVSLATCKDQIPIVLNLCQWPIQTKDNVLAAALKWCQMLTYSQDHFEAYYSEFHIQTFITQPPSGFFTQYPTQLRHAAIIAVVALKVYLNDMRALVVQEVTSTCNAAGALGDALAATLALRSG